MLEILREPPHSPWVLFIFFIQAMIYIFLYNNDTRLLSNFFSSILDKKYHINYGRHSRTPQNSLLLLTLQVLLTGALIISEYLVFCSEYSGFSHLFFLAISLLIFVIVLKFVLVHILGILVKKQSKYEEFSSLSLQYFSLFLTPIVFVFPYFYLSNTLNLKLLSFFMGLTFMMYCFSKLKLFLHIRNIFRKSAYYYILYICTFELVPLYWLLIALDC